MGMKNSSRGEATLGSISEAGLRLHRADGAGWSFQSGSVVDTDANRVTGQIAGFSVWGLVRNACKWDQSQWGRCAFGE